MARGKTNRRIIEKADKYYGYAQVNLNMAIDAALNHYCQNRDNNLAIKTCSSFIEQRSITKLVEAETIHHECFRIARSYFRIAAKLYCYAQLFK